MNVTACDVLIVGTGVAGLFAADRALALLPDARVTLIDAGLPLDKRGRFGAADWGGYGGAGLFLGGRVYLGPGTLPVLPPTTIPATLRPLLDDEAYLRYAGEVNALLDQLGAVAPIRQQPSEGIIAAMERATAAGLDYITSYPARFLSIEERLGVLSALQRQLVERGAQFHFATRVEAIEPVAGGGYRVSLRVNEDDGDDRDEGGRGQAEARVMLAQTLLLAPGRYGAEWLVGLARELGVETVALPVAFGVRLEMAAEAYAPLSAINPDPRLQRMTEDDALFKTYATCPGGEVIALTRYGRFVASGVPLAGERRRPSTTVAALAQPGVVGAAGAWRGGETVARALNARYPGALVVQRLGDVRAGRPTTAEALRANPTQPTYAAAIPGALYDAYPAIYWRAFEDFMGRVSQLAPGCDSDETLVYGPAEEQFWHIPTDETLETTLAGLFVAGDGAGQSQGVTQAAIAGLLAGAGLAQRLGRVG